MKYSSTVDQLLHYGIFEYHYDWSNYLALGFTLEDVPALLQLAMDREIYQHEDQRINSAPLHAWRILGLLKAVEVCEPILAEIIEEDEWGCEEPFRILALIGEPALAYIDEYFSNPLVSDNNKLKVTEAFAEMVKYYPELRGQCIALLEKYLVQITEDYSDFAGFIVCALVHLQAKESIEIIRSAYQQGYVANIVIGDIEDVEMQLGLRQQRSTEKTIPPQIKEVREMMTKVFGTVFDDEKSEPLPKQKPLPKPVPDQTVKVGRNEPCPCGSGKKYKKCCLS